MLRFVTEGDRGHTVVITYEYSNFYVYDPGYPDKKYCRLLLSDYIENNYKEINNGNVMYTLDQMSFIVVYT